VKGQSAGARRGVPRGSGVALAVAAAVLAGVLLARWHGAWPAWLVTEALVVGVAWWILRGASAGPGDGPDDDDWTPTDQVSVDPLTGERLRLFTHRRTGARRYLRDDPSRRPG
jgi:hypothetical protein